MFKQMLNSLAFGWEFVPMLTVKFLYLNQIPDIINGMTPKNISSSFLLTIDILKERDTCVNDHTEIIWSLFLGLSCGQLI